MNSDPLSDIANNMQQYMVVTKLQELIDKLDKVDSRLAKIENLLATQDDDKSTYIKG